MSGQSTVPGQGMTYNPNWNEEQGNVVMDIERDEFMHFEEPECLKRFPSNENFDEDKALMHSFGLKTIEWIDEEGMISRLKVF